MELTIKMYIIVFLCFYTIAHQVIWTACHWTCELVSTMHTMYYECIWMII